MAISDLFESLLGIVEMEHGGDNTMKEYYLTELIKPVQEAYYNDTEKCSQIAHIELAYFYILEWKDMRCFRKEIKRDPEMYAEMASIIYKKDGEEKQKEQTEEQRNQVTVIYKLFDKAKFCPAEEDGFVDEMQLREWVLKLKSLLESNQQMSLFGFLLGRLLVNSPVGSDNYYPAEAVREIIEEFADEELISEYKLSVYNRRGVFSPSAGREENAIANGFNEMAVFFSTQYPKTSEIYYGLYRTYLADAKREREKAENGQF